MNTLVLIGLALLFFALIMASIALHEIGHLVPAKLFGVKVTQYFVGFGRTIWSRKRGETEYGFKMFPLGGYVRLVGMYPPEKQTDKPKGWLTRMADQARSYEYEEIAPATMGGSSIRNPCGRRSSSCSAGRMNVLLAFLIFLGINFFHGTWQSTLEVTVVNDCVIPAGRVPATCQDGDPQTPAKQAGMQVGDKVVAFNGHAISNWNELTDLIRANRDGAAAITVERGGQVIELPTVNTIIQPVSDKLDPSSRVEAGFLGVSPGRELVRGGVIETAGQMWNTTQMSVVALASFPSRVWNVGVGLVTGAERDINSPISVVGASRVAGEIAVSDSLPVEDRAVTWLSLLGSVNLFVALLNLVPLLPLDGGHVAGALYEALRRGIARLRGRGDPGPVDTAKMLPVAYVVGGFLLIGGVVLILADIISPIKLF